MSQFTVYIIILINVYCLPVVLRCNYMPYKLESQSIIHKIVLMLNCRRPSWLY